VEPAIGHLKSDHRLDRGWLQGALGGALHTISCAVGYNLCWLMRQIARRHVRAPFLGLPRAMGQSAYGGFSCPTALQTWRFGHWMVRPAVARAA
jgi:hypothetical protein